MANKHSGVKEINVKLEGIRPIIFDRYPGDNSTILPPKEKMYLAPDGKTVVLPTLNVYSFLGATNTRSAPKAVLDTRKYKSVAQACMGFVTIDPDPDIPFQRNGKDIQLSGFVNGVDSGADMYIMKSVARLDKGVPNPKERPVLSLPWELQMVLTLYPTPNLNEVTLKKLFVDGGMAVGFGTYRGPYGKFGVVRWESVE